MSIIFAILLFSLLIFVHELGHFLAAKASGVQVNEFAMFMGPAIFKKTIGETTYSLRCIPIGGYCAMEGENDDSDSPRSFQKARWWKRLIILVAGAAMNFLAGLIIIAVVLANTGDHYVAPELSVVESWSSLAGEGGLQAGDTIVKLDGKRIDIYQDFALATIPGLFEEGSHDITVLRNGEKLVLTDVPMVRKEVKQEDGSVALKYGLTFARKENTPSAIAKRIWPTAMSYVDSVIISLRMLITGQAGFTDMSGPVGIVDMMSDTANAAPTVKDAIIGMLDFGGLIAINLAVMNLLPFPALDGGRVAGLLIVGTIQRITKKKLDPKYEGYVHAVGMLLLLALMAVIMFKDILFIIKR